MLFLWYDWGSLTDLGLHIFDSTGGVSMINVG